VHGFIQPLHDIGEAVDMGNLRLCTQPGSKGLESLQVLGFRNTAGLAGVDGKLQNIRTREVGGGEICIDPKRDAFIKPLDKAVI